MARLVLQRYPTLNIEGTTFPPPRWRSLAATVVQIFKFSLLIIVIAGLNPFPHLGLDTPEFMAYANDNKVSVCLLAFFVGGLIESQMLSTGAFEITLNDIPIWSKLQSNRIPRPDELLQMISSHMQFSNPGAPGMSFSQGPGPN